MAEVVRHPAQRALVSRLVKLIRDLRACSSPEDYFAFQEVLFRDLLGVEKRRAECSRVVKRLARGKAVPSGCMAPANSLEDEVERWEFETLLYERLARQLRTVGDALAWRCFNYDRRVILTMSDNASPGPMYPKRGLQAEWAHVQNLWHGSRHLALLHDLTNCLRIADVTEFAAENRVEFHEVKAGGRGNRTQTKRAMAAVNALMTGAPLPGKPAGRRIVKVEQVHRTDLNKVNGIIPQAKDEGYASLVLSDGRAAVVTSLVGDARNWHEDPSGVRETLETVFNDAKRRAGIAATTHHMTVSSADIASRWKHMPPLSIYPFAPEDCAFLVCDLLILNTFVSLETLVEQLAEAGMDASLEESVESEGSEDEKFIISARMGNRAVTMPLESLIPLCLEAIALDTWSLGVREVVAMDTPPPVGMVIFSEEGNTWGVST